MRLEEYLSTFKRDLEILIDEGLHEKEGEYNKIKDLEEGIYYYVYEIGKAYSGNKDVMRKNNFSQDSYDTLEYIINNVNEYIFLATRPIAGDKLETKLINLLNFLKDEKTYQ